MRKAMSRAVLQKSMDAAGENGDWLRAERHRLSISKRSKKHHVDETSAKPLVQPSPAEVEVVEAIDVLDSP